MSDWKQTIDSIAKLELLSFFEQNPSAMDSSVSLSIWTGLDSQQTEQALAELERSGFVSNSGGIYYYAPGDPQKEQAKKAVDAYRTHRSLLRTEIAQAAQESKTLKQELLRERSQTEAVLDSIGEAIWLASKDGNFKPLNPQTEILLGAAKIPAVAQLSMKNACASPGKSIEFSHAGKVLRVRARPLQDDAQAGFVLTLYDVTQEAETEKIKTDFTKMLTHDLRSPLSGVLSIFDLMLRDNSGLESKLRRMAEMGRKSTLSLLQLVNHLLEVGKLEDGHMGLAKNKLCLEELVDEALALLQALFTERGLRIEKIYNEGNRTIVEGDHELLSRAITNLLSNAAKYSKKDSRVQLNCYSAETKAHFTVRDFGEGIPTEALDKIFDRYFRVTEKGKSQAIGTGLGLYFVKLVADAHKGQVSAMNCLPGCLFDLALPIHFKPHEA